MVEGGPSGNSSQSGSSSSSHSSSSSTSSKGTKLLIRLSPSVQTDRIHSFFDKSLVLAKPAISCGFVKKVYRKSDESVVVVIEEREEREDPSIARRLVSIFSDSRPKIDGHEFSIEFYRPEHSKSLSSPSQQNGDKRKEKESSRMSSCSSSSSPSTSKRPSYSSPSSSRPSTSTHDSNRKECVPSSPPLDSFTGIVGVSIQNLPDMCEKTLKEILRNGLRWIGKYLTHFHESGMVKVILKRSFFTEEMDSQGPISVQGEETTFNTMSMEETRRLFDKYSSMLPSRDSLPSTSTSSHPSITFGRERFALSYESSRTIFLPCLPKGINKEYMRKRFCKIGHVLGWDLKNVSSVAPHAIVQFSHTQGAVLAMDDYEMEQKREGQTNPARNKKHPHFVRSHPSNRVWVANLPPHDEDYVKKKLLELLRGAQNPTIVVDLRRREGIIDFASLDKAKHFLEIFKSCPVIQQGGSVHTWLVADYCSDELYTHFIERRSCSPSVYECDYISTLTRVQLTETQKSQAQARMERLKGGDEKEKKKSINGENGHHANSPSSYRRLNGEDRRSGDSGFSEDRDKGNQVLDSDDDEVLERKWRTVVPPETKNEENGKMKKRLLGLDEKMATFINEMPKRENEVKKEIKEEEEGEKKENEKMTKEERVNHFRNALLSVTTPLKARSIDEMAVYRGKDPLKSPPIPVSPLNGDKDRRHLVHSPPSGSRPAPLHINIPPSTSTSHSPFPRLPPSTSSSRHPSISTPTLTPRSNTLPSNRPHFPSSDHNGDHQWNGVGTPRVPLSRRESVCSNSSQSTPLPPSQPSTSTGGGNALKSPSTWNTTGNGWKSGSLTSPLPSSLHRPRPSTDSLHKASTSSQPRPKQSMDKSGYTPTSTLPKTFLPRSSSMSEKKHISKDSSKDIVNSIIQNETRDMKKMPRIPKKENRERDEKEERREKRREEKEREKREEREERKEKKEDRKKSRENETKEQKTERRKEKKKKEKEKEERKKSLNEKKRKSIDVEKKKKKKHRRTSSDSESDSDSDDFKPSSSSQMKSDEALARIMSGGSMYDRVKGRRSGPSKEEKKKNEALEALKRKNQKKIKKRVHLSSSSEEEEKERGKKTKKEEEEEESSEDEKERMKKEKKKEKKREKRETTEESDSEEEREKERREQEKRKNIQKKISKNSSNLDLFSDADSEKSERKDKLSKKRSLDKGENDCFPSTSTQPPEKKMKKEESSSSGSESEGERSSKKSEVSTSSWKGREGKRLSESSIATEKEFGRTEEAWKSPMSVDREIKEEPKEEPHPPRPLTKAAMKDFTTASPSPISTWTSREEKRGIEEETIESSDSSSDEEEERKEEEKREEEEEREERIEEGERREEGEEKEEDGEDRVKVEEEEEEEEEEPVEVKEEEKEEEEPIDEVKMEEEEEGIQMELHSQSDLRALELPSDDVIEETEKAVESIFDEDEEPEVHYPSTDFHQVSHDLNISSSSSQSSSPKLSSSSLTRPSLNSPSFHPHLVQSHSLPPISSPLVSPHLITSPSASRPSSIHNYNVRPISQESSSHQMQDDNGVPQEKSWTPPQGSSSDGPSPSPAHPTMNMQEIKERFPMKWQGTVEVKKCDIQTSWHKMHGEDDFIKKVLPSFDANIKVSGKFRLDNDSIQSLVETMERSADTACLVVTPAGANVDEVNKNKKLFVDHLVNFFISKNIAGVIEFTTEEGHAYRCHMFAPGKFTTDYLSPRYPDFLELLNNKFPNSFLLALLKRKEE